MKITNLFNNRANAAKGQGRIILPLFLKPTFSIFLSLFFPSARTETDHQLQEKLFRMSRAVCRIRVMMEEKRDDDRKENFEYHAGIIPVPAWEVAVTLYFQVR